MSSHSTGDSASGVALHATTSEDSATGVNTPDTNNTTEKQIINSSERNTKRYHITKDDFFKETSDAIRGALASTTAEVILTFLRCDRAVFIEHLGIVFPELRTELRAIAEQDFLYLRNEKTRLPNFEKTDDLTSSHLEVFSDIVETRELASAIYARLPVEIQLAVSPSEARRLLKGLFKAIRHEVVTKGFSPWLSAVGDFFAIHNRQGGSAADWYGGADIFLVPKTSDAIEVGQSKKVARPILESAFEIFESWAGPAMRSWKVEPLAQLRSMGIIEDDGGKGREFEVRAFKALEEDGKLKLIYASNGIRQVRDSATNQTRNEFVVCVTLDSGLNNNQNIPDWPIRAFCLAWALTAHLGSEESLKPGHGTASEYPIYSNQAGKALNTILLTEFHLASLEQLADDGPFKFFSVIPLLEDEARFAEQRSSSHLLAILRHKGVTRFAAENRGSVLLRSR